MENENISPKAQRAMDEMKEHDQLQQLVENSIKAFITSAQDQRGKNSRSTTWFTN